MLTYSGYVYVLSRTSTILCYLKKVFQSVGNLYISSLNLTTCF